MDLSSDITTANPTVSLARLRANHRRLEGMSRSFVTKVHKSKEGSESLRTTLTESVATILGVQRGDSLMWTVEAELRRVTVTKRSASHRVT